MSDKPLTILAIDCSTSACSAAVRGPLGLLAAKRRTGRGQAEAMVPLIGEALEAAGLDWPEIDLIGITVGPGSFTGLRIGLAAARALSLARRIPVAGVTTADLLAFSLPEDVLRGRPFLIAIESKRDDLFVQSFGADGKPAGEIEALLPEDALARWHGDFLAGPLLVAGDAVEALPQMRNARVAQRGVADEAALLRDLCETLKYGSLCALGGFTPYPVLSALEHFPEDFGLEAAHAAA